MNKRTIILLLALFFMLRLVVIFFVAKEKPVLIGDSPQYNNYALAILKGPGWLHSADFMGSYREPAYPLFLAISYLLFGKENFIAVFILQALANVLTIFIIYKLALKMFGREAAVLAFFWSGFYCYYYWYTALLLREVFIFFYFTLFVYYLYLYLVDGYHKKINFTISILSFFALLFTDLRYIYLFPCVFLVFIFYKRPLEGVKNFFIFAFIIILLVAPWISRNFIIYKKPLAADSQNLIIPKAIFKAGRDILFYQKGHLIADKHYLFPEEKSLIKQGFNPNNRTNDEIVAIKNDKCPISTIPGMLIDNLIVMWSPYMPSDYYRHVPACQIEKYSIRHNVSALVCYGILLPFAVMGIIYLVRRQKKIALFLLVWIFFNTIAHVPIWGHERYRNATDSLLIILGTYGMSMTYKLISRRQT
ncbi:MAG: glycosyltransferase family 39 protein [Candidatus Omnitrophica bacterium]|nr:glycosyltransferase family 39 protein [Candidatus Omnitrophota bacterium]